MTNLTEKWKNGKLKKGKKYWCKLQDGTSEICYLWLQTNHFTILTGYQSKGLTDEDITEILAPIPSYEEWEEKQKALKVLAEAYCKEKQENDKLKKLEKNLNNCVQIQSISIDMSTEEAPYNRIYAKPIEKQGDVLLCEFENANYDVEQKSLKQENDKLKELLKECYKMLAKYHVENSEPSLCENIQLLIKIDEVLK